MRKFSALFLSLLLVISLIQTPNMKVKAYGIDYNYIDNLMSEVGFSPYYDDSLNIRLSGYDKVGSFNSNLGNVAGGRFANFLVSKSTVNGYYVITPMTKEIFSNCEYNITYCGALRGFDVSTEEGRKEAISFLASEFDDKNYNISFTLNLKSDTAFYVHPREAAYTSERTTYNGGQLAFLDINDSRIDYCYINCEKCSQVATYCCSYCPALKQFGMENDDYENEVHFPKACCYNSTALKFIDYYAGYGDVIFDEYAFAKCRSLIHIMGGSGSNQAISNWNNTTYTGGGYVYKDYAFSGCTSLTHINFTTSDFTLGAYAFGKSGLQYIGMFDYDATQYNYLSSYREYAKELIRKSNISDKAFDGVNANRVYVGHKEIYDILDAYGDGKFFGRRLCVANINVKFDGTDTTSGTMTNRTIRYDDDNYTLSNQYGRDGYVFDSWTNEKNINLVNDYNAPHNGIDWVEAFQVYNGETVIRPVWSAKEYKINYVLNGGETGNAELPDTYTSGQNISMLGTPEKAGYDFDGWYEDKALTVPFGGISETSTGDKTYYAKWNPHTTTITYVVGEGKNDPKNPHTINGDDGSVSLLPAVREGYTFLGWSREENGTIIETITAADGDMVLYAVWEKCKYSIYYELNGGDGSEANLPEYHTYGENISRLPVPVRVGYDFAGWYEDANLTIPFGGIADKDMEVHTYYAKWTVHVVMITYETGEGENDPRNPKTIKQEDGRVELYPATREGYTFTGWSTGKNDELKEYITAADGDLTLTAVWEKCKYAIHYELNGGDGSDADLPEYHTYGENVTELPEPVRVGYDFAGWYEDANLTIPFGGIADKDMEEHIYYAKWKVHVVTITYETGEGENDPRNPKTIKREDGRVELYPATREGYTFTGWSTGENEELKEYITAADGDLTLTAVWEKCKYAIHYELNGGDGSDADLPEYHTYGENVTELPEPVRVGYDFAGWYEDMALTKMFNGIPATDMNEHTYYAKWNVHVITVTYVLNGGKNHPDNPGTMNPEMERTTLYPATKEGYTFLGWSTDETGSEMVEYLLSSMGDITLYAQFEKMKFAIHYELNGGDSADAGLPEYHTYGENIAELQTPVRVGYDFAGWYEDETFTTPFKGISSTDMKEHTYYAKWIVHVITVTYVLDGGKNHPDNPTTLEKDAERYMLYPATREGYDFKGWSTGDNDDIKKYITAADGDLTLYAIWEQCKYAITYELNGGDSTGVSLPEYHTYGENISELPQPIRAGYDFDGWFEDKDFTTSFAGITSTDKREHVYYAKWNVHMIKITYELDGGTNSVDNPEILSFDSPRVELKAPTKTGYDFQYWTDGLDDSKVEYLMAANGDQTLWAVWKPHEYPIRYELNGGTSTGDAPSKYTFGKICYLMVPPVKDKYVFEGWYSDAAFTRRVYDIAAGTDGDITLYAKWSEAVANLSVPEKEGYRFLGWVDKKGIPIESTERLADHKGNIYANWLDVRWTVKKTGTKVYKKTLKADYDWYAKKEKKGDKDSFTENSEDGSIQIYGTAHGYVTRKNISVTISGKIKSVELERDGKEIAISADYFSKKNADNIYLKGYPITADGVYELTVSSATSSKTIIFMKDSKKPIVTGKETTKKITVSKLKEKVRHTTKTVKKKGNKTTKTVKKGKQKTVTKISYDTFEIDKPQSMYLNKKADGNPKTTYVASVSWKDSTAGVSTVYVNGKKLSAKKIKKGIYVFKKAGTYKIEVYDFIGNHYSQTIKVSDSVKDWKAPIFNVVDNATYEAGVKVSCTDKDSGIRNFEITDWHGFKKNIKKKSYTIKSAGTYVLTAIDKAGNSKSVKIKVVKKTKY